jgi:hypothetical protein
MTQPLSVAEDPESSEPQAPTLTVPLGWLLDQAAGPIAYRAAVEVAALDPTTEPAFSVLPMTSPTAIALAVTQSLDGSWNSSMLTLPKHGKMTNGVGTIPAVRRLLEYGWAPDTPPLLHARRILFRLLAEDNDPKQLFELASKATHPDIAHRNRAILREAAASALAQAGYESDPRLRGAARRVLERVDAFLDSALADKPWVRIGNRHVLATEAEPPSIHNLTMLAHMPIFRSEHFPEMERLYAYLTQAKPTQEAVQMYGTELIMQPHLVMGDLLHNRNVVDSDVPFAVLWLEMMARLNFLKRNEGWMKLFERLVDDCDQRGVWHPHKKGATPPSSTNPYVWPTFPLEERLVGEACWTDVTFRIGRIAKLLGWRIEVV